MQEMRQGRLRRIGRKLAEIIGSLAPILVAAAVLALVVACSGCAEYDFRITEGFSTAAEVSCSQGSAKAAVLSGVLVEANEVGRARYWYTHAETNSYFGVVSSSVNKSLVADFTRATEEPQEAPDIPDNPEPEPGKPDNPDNPETQE